jgi:sigma-B regulation protein RsbU (phosphoserine phosphatase)
MFAPEVSAAQVLQTFHQDAPRLFLGASFVAVGLVAGAFAAIRRKHDSLLIYFSLFAVVYGMRLWIQSGLLVLTFQRSAFYPQLRAGIDFLVPVPAFLFFNNSGWMTRIGRWAGYLMIVVGTVLGVATFALGLRIWFYTINNVAVIVAMGVIATQFLRRAGDDRDFVIVRRGLVVFTAGVLLDNLGGLLFPSLILKVEPYTFVVLLASLGYVAARRSLERDRQLSEIQQELEIARRIQLSILPAQFPQSANFRVAARYVPMTSVAGDFYDFIVADEKCAGLLIADVSGHGVPAALIASMVKLAATSQRANASDPSGVLAGMNSALYGNTQNQFVTAAYVHLDSEARELRYSAAGHPPMLLLRDGKVREVAENGLILAAFDFATYSTAAQRLQTGDRLLLYTDGVVEAASASGEFFGQDSLGALLRQTAAIAPADAADRIISAVQQWSQSQDDDLTVLVCDYVGNGSGTLN